MLQYIYINIIYEIFWQRQRQRQRHRQRQRQRQDGIHQSFAQFTMSCLNGFQIGGGSINMLDVFAIFQEQLVMPNLSYDNTIKIL